MILLIYCMKQKNKFIAFSGGVESTTMCLLFGANAKAIFSDTGWEHQIMYDRIDAVEDQIKKIHPDFEIVKGRGVWIESVEGG